AWRNRCGGPATRRSAGPPGRALSHVPGRRAARARRPACRRHHGSCGATLRSSARVLRMRGGPHADGMGPCATIAARYTNRQTGRSAFMSAIFQSLGKTLVAGVVVLILIMLAVGGMGDKLTAHVWWAFFFRWLHVLSGVMWIGLLWYFNFVQTPSMPKIPDEHKPAVSKVIAPTALFWFRWAAASTVLTGLILAGMNGYLVQALTL